MKKKYSTIYIILCIVVVILIIIGVVKLTTGDKDKTGGKDKTTQEFYQAKITDMMINSAKSYMEEIANKITFEYNWNETMLEKIEMKLGDNRFIIDSTNDLKLIEFNDNLIQCVKALKFLISRGDLIYTEKRDPLFFDKSRNLTVDGDKLNCPDMQKLNTFNGLVEIMYSHTGSECIKRKIRLIGDCLETKCKYRYLGIRLTQDALMDNNGSFLIDKIKEYGKMLRFMDEALNF